MKPNQEDTEAAIALNRVRHKSWMWMKTNPLKLIDSKTEVIASAQQVKNTFYIHSSVLHGIPFSCNLLPVYQDQVTEA